MTETKTKPDAWRYWRDEEPMMISLLPPKPTEYDKSKYPDWRIEPVSIVPPALLGWVEKVRIGFKEGWIRQSELGPNLLAELEQILSEEK